MDEGPAAAPAAPGLSGPELDAACRLVARLAPDPAIAGPVWWDANAPDRRVTYVARASEPLPPGPWPARRALDLCSALALALAPVHEAGAAHGALLPGAVEQRPGGGPLVRVPGGSGTAADDLRGIGGLLLELLTGRRAGAATVVSGAHGAEASTAALLTRLLAADPVARPSARAAAAELAEIAAAVPDSEVAAGEHEGERGHRRRGRIALAAVLLLVAGGSGVYVAGHHVGPAGPSLSPATVTVPPATVSP